MSSSTSPIHSLLAAEEEAQGIVSRARGRFSYESARVLNGRVIIDNAGDDDNRNTEDDSDDGCVNNDDGDGCSNYDVDDDGCGNDDGDDGCGNDDGDDDDNDENDENDADAEGVHAWAMMMRAAARQQKLKLAKEEAEKEMALYRAKKEEEFRSKLEGLGDEKGLRLQQLEEITTQKSMEMWNLGQATVGDVSDWLLKLVMTV
ncbi:hypothetical protein CBR_g46903 [Chara braunii]|uniref:Uncharacterized protein n=1 Tax=Chara braunii TaxID=69332 RepID=A0A388M185_CHABU|nr:hypothetical protein CBR_g46903 [Chara braunii]|eukprot:GBG88338.1 hypothetical protein CBR_g46903 [Chara braunii]